MNQAAIRRLENKVRTCTNCGRIVAQLQRAETGQAISHAPAFEYKESYLGEEFKPSNFALKVSPQVGPLLQLASGDLKAKPVNCPPRSVRLWVPPATDSGSVASCPSIGRRRACSHLVTPAMEKQRSALEGCCPKPTCFDDGGIDPHASLQGVPGH